LALKEVTIKVINAKTNIKKIFPVRFELRKGKRNRGNPIRLLIR
jgi:hypothetical protein